MIQSVVVPMVANANRRSRVQRPTASGLFGQQSATMGTTGTGESEFGYRYLAAQPTRSRCFACVKPAPDPVITRCGPNGFVGSMVQRNGSADNEQ